MTTLYKLSDAEKGHFRSISDIDSQAFIITMTEFALSDVRRYKEDPTEATLGQAAAQMHVLSEMALKKYGFQDFAAYIDDAAAELKSVTPPQCPPEVFRPLDTSLAHAAETMRRLCGQGGGMGGSISGGGTGSFPTSAEREASLKKLCDAINEHPTNLKDREVVDALAEFLKTCRYSDIYAIKSWASGQSHYLPEHLKPLEDAVPAHKRGKLKDLCNDAIVRRQTGAWIALSDPLELSAPSTRDPEVGARRSGPSLGGGRGSGR